MSHELVLHSARAKAFQRLMRTKGTKPHICLLSSFGPVVWKMFMTDSFQTMLEHDLNVKIMIPPDNVMNRLNALKKRIVLFICYGVMDYCAVSFIHRYADYQVTNEAVYNVTCQQNRPAFMLSKFH